MSNGFEEIVAGVSPHSRQLAEQARELIRDVYQNVVEVPWSKQRVIGYGYGAEPPDSEKLLEGSGRLLRHVRVTEFAQVSSPALRQLLITAKPST